MNIQQFLVKFDRETQQQQERLEAACAEAKAVFLKHFPIDGKNLDAPQALAACVELFDLEDHKNAGQLYLEWLVEHYIGRKVAANIDDIKMVVEALEAMGFIEDNPYVFNDYDNQLFYIPHEKLIFCTKLQNTRYIYILCDNRLYIRRYYDEYDFDADESEGEYTANKQGTHETIVNATWITEQWSDCVVGNQYPHRPSLQYFKDCDFSPSRDIGYVLDYESLMGPRADRVIFCYTDVKMAFFQLRCAVEEATTGFKGH